MVTLTVTPTVLPKRFGDAPPTPKKLDSVHTRLDMRTAHQFWTISNTLRFRAWRWCRWDGSGICRQGEPV
jgi:hypothetical protein